MKIVIFGASVSEQTVRHDDNSITGYVNYLEKNIQELGLDYDIYRVTAGSCSINDAGLALVGDVVDLKPDLCILDWCTAGDTSCRYEYVSYIYDELTSNNIVPVNLVLPRADRDQTKTEVYQFIKKISDKYIYPFWDFSSQTTNLLLSKILRDSVHTNELGAKLYSNYVLYSLMNMVLPSIQKVDNELRLTREINEIKKEDNKLTSMGVELISDNSFLDSSIYVFLEQRVGPWSRKINCNLIINKTERKFLGEVLLHDPWSWRERQCIKPLAPFFHMRENVKSFILDVSVEKKDMSFMRFGKDKVDYSRFYSELRPKGRLIVLCDTKGYLIKSVVTA